MPSPRAWLLAILCGLSLGCSRPRRGDFRGVTTPSADGKTYLVISAGEGPPCAPLVDEQPWPNAPEVPGLVAPGPHSIGCTGDAHRAAIEVHAGATYRFKAWGP